MRSNIGLRADGAAFSWCRHLSPKGQSHPPNSAPTVLTGDKSRNFASGKRPISICAVQFFSALAALLLASALFGAEARPRVVTSFLPLYCWAANVAGEHAVVENLLPPRAEPHEYAFTPGDARKLS